MKTPVILAIDEGTTNAKAITVDKCGTIQSKGNQSLELQHPQPGWAEQDAEAIYDGVLIAIREALEHQVHFEVNAIGISNQRESILIWDRQTGKAVTPVVNWQCRRSIHVCEKIQKNVSGQNVVQITGLPLDPLFPAAKLTKLLQEIPDGVRRAENGELCAGTVDTWLVWKLTAGRIFATDVSNASRTQLFNLSTQDWDESLLNLFNVPRPCLPKILPSCGYRGETIAVPGIIDGTPIFSQIGDSHAALYGHGGFRSGLIKATYGTGSSLMTSLTSVKMNNKGIVNTVAWNDGELNLALEGNITHSGAGFHWIGNMLGVSELSKLSEMAAALESNQGVYFVPALAGLGAPYWDTAARGVICGLTDSCKPETLARAGLEAMAYQTADVFYLMEEVSSMRLNTLLVDGGPTKNRWLMQFQADLLQREIIINKNEAVSAVGAAYLAGKGLGWWKNREVIHHLKREVEIIEPQKMTEQMQRNYAGWTDAVRKSLLHN